MIFFFNYWWVITTFLRISNPVYRIVFLVLAVEKKTKFSRVSFTFGPMKRFFLFLLLNWKKIVENLGKTRLIVWCREQDIWSQILQPYPMLSLLIFRCFIWSSSLSAWVCILISSQSEDSFRNRSTFFWSSIKIFSFELTTSISGDFSSGCFKGQLNSEWIYEVIVGPKIPTKNTKISALEVYYFKVNTKRESMFFLQEDRISFVLTLK